MFVGYELVHPRDCYRMWYPTTKEILITRDAIWLQRMFFQPKNNKTKTTEVARSWKLGKGNETLMDITDDEVSHALESYMAKETNNKRDKHVEQETNFMLEPAVDPA